MDKIFQKIRKKYSRETLIGFIIGFIGEVFMDRITGGINDMIDAFLSSISIDWVSNILGLVLHHPFTTLGTLIITYVVIRACIDVYLLKTIKISHKEQDNGVLLFVHNRTEYNLENSYLALTYDIEPRPQKTTQDMGRIIFGADLPDEFNDKELLWLVDEKLIHRTTIESGKSKTCHIIYIEQSGDAGFLVKPYTGRQLINLPLQKPINRSIIYLDKGETKAKIRFSGTKPNDEIVTEYFELHIIYEDHQVKVNRIKPCRGPKRKKTKNKSSP